MKALPKDDAESLKWARKAAVQGNVVAQVMVGDMYRDGKGVKKDFALALKWFRKAADQGDANGELNIGGMYVDGEA